MVKPSSKRTDARRRLAIVAFEGVLFTNLVIELTDSCLLPLCLKLVKESIYVMHLNSEIP